MIKFVVKFALGFCLGCILLFFPLGQFQADGLDSLRTLAVQLDGRQKPLDTVAKETVAKIHGATTYQLANGVLEDYLSTYLELWFNSRNWQEEPFVLVSYRPLKELVDLDLAQRHFSDGELVTNQKLTAVLELAHGKQLKGLDLNRDEQEALIVEERLNLLHNTVGNLDLPLVPPPTDIQGVWSGLNQATSLYEPGAIAPLVADFAGIQQAVLQNGIEDLALLPGVASLATEFKMGLRSLNAVIYPSDFVLAREVHFNHFHPFAKAWQLYGLAFMVMLVGLWVKPWDLYWTAMGLFSTGIAVQTYGFLLRMQIAGRPPVTNMYESVVWVGFGIAAIALIFELMTRNCYYVLVAAPLSVICLILADSLPTLLDPSITPLIPVLRDNFWLSIHVPTIALSYASFALAMGLGHVALGNYLFTPNAQPRLKLLSQLNYRVLQVGVLLLMIGIIFGGVWANFSWGRFWDWDPKETWALIALLCYLAPLYGRLVGWISDFGVHVASIISFNAVLMAWYGVNFVLGTGLHSYGFGTGGSALLIAGVVGSDLLLVLVTTMKHKGWFRPVVPEPLATAENSR
jgi:cytochrome c-type biogenesis protein CcsB